METKGLRILFIHSGSDLYGASRSLLRLSSRLAQDGAAVLAVLPQSGPLLTALESQGIRVVVQETLSVLERPRLARVLGRLYFALNLLRSIFALFLLIRRFRPDLVHTMTSVLPSTGPAARLAGIPHVWHIRESFGEFGNLWKYYQKYIAWFSTIIICVSTPIALQFEDRLRERKVRVIHNGFPLQEFAGLSAERVQRFREHYLDQEGQCLIGLVGRIKFKRKGQEVFVHAAHLLREKFPQARYLCIGSPYPGNESHLVNLRNLIRELGMEDAVVYAGDVEDIKAAIAALDILVLASAQPEPFAGVVIEAMALARPVVATAIGGSLEQVVEGETGYLVRPGDPHSMAEGIEKLLQSPQRRLEFGYNGRKRFLEMFEFEPFYRKMLGQYAATLVHLQAKAEPK